ncbi:MAG: glucan biosynthesis protein [Pseudomonadota bacterium]
MTTLKNLMRHFGRGALAAAALGVLSPAHGQEPPSAAFGFETVQRLAEARAASDYEAAERVLPPVLANLDYDAYRDIRFRPQAALWRDVSRFEVQLFHRGGLFVEPVRIHQVLGERVLRVAYSPTLFDFGKNTAPAELASDFGFAGFRIHYPLHKRAYKDELIVFLGASYFRVLGRNQLYGLSARGLAVNTATPEGEEFPRFTDFWLVRPAPQDDELVIYALLDSPSIAGAYRFIVRPAAITQVEVTAVLYPRLAIAKLGLAPLTSMFLLGENQPNRVRNDFRPEVHDSDGLLAHTGWREWLWRPLANPRGLRVSRLLDDNPKGFGLVQRDRDFDHYQDLEAGYERRPGYWITPLEDWGKGAVELVEIPTESEIHDNIAAYWVSEAQVPPGTALRFSYILSAFTASADWPPGGRVIATRVGRPPFAGAQNPSSGRGERLFIVDFAGGELDGLAEGQPLEAKVVASRGALRDVTVTRVPASGAWRVAFYLKPPGSQAVDLRATLSLYGHVLSESWTYLWTPE